MPARPTNSPKKAPNRVIRYERSRLRQDLTGVLRWRSSSATDGYRTNALSRRSELAEGLSKGNETRAFRQAQ